MKPQLISLNSMQSECQYQLAFKPGEYLYKETTPKHTPLSDSRYEQGIFSVIIVPLTTASIQKIWDFLRFKYLSYQYEGTQAGTIYTDPERMGFDDGDYFDIVPDVLTNILHIAANISEDTYKQWRDIIKNDTVINHNYFNPDTFLDGGFELHDAPETHEGYDVFTQVTKVDMGLFDLITDKPEVFHE